MGLDAGLRRHDGAPEALRYAYHPLTCIFEGGHEDHEVQIDNFSKPSCPSCLRGKIPNSSVSAKTPSRVPTTRDRIFPHTGPDDAGP